ncbi:hypothetical protein TRVA0_016S00958 [Trichomonascus vanleenenianus]|uniref:uncharacterized protein n=1 Tax=Trichomonascus vanleenenianus TaxID=2268995 RepID=UPI003ECAE177
MSHQEPQDWGGGRDDRDRRSSGAESSHRGHQQSRRRRRQPVGQQQLPSGPGIAPRRLVLDSNRLPLGFDARALSILAGAPHYTITDFFNSLSLLLLAKPLIQNRYNESIAYPPSMVTHMHQYATLMDVQYRRVHPAGQLTKSYQMVSRYITVMEEHIIWRLGRVSNGDGKFIAYLFQNAVSPLEVDFYDRHSLIEMVRYVLQTPCRMLSRYAYNMELKVAESLPEALGQYAAVPDIFTSFDDVSSAEKGGDYFPAIINVHSRADHIGFGALLYFKKEDSQLQEYFREKEYQHISRAEIEQLKQLMIDNFLTAFNHALHCCHDYTNRAVVSDGYYYIFAELPEAPDSLVIDLHDRKEIRVETIYIANIDQVSVPIGALLVGFLYRHPSTWRYQGQDYTFKQEFDLHFRLEDGSRELNQQLMAFDLVFEGRNHARDVYTVNMGLGELIKRPGEPSQYTSLYRFKRGDLKSIMQSIGQLREGRDNEIIMRVWDVYKLMQLDHGQFYIHALFNRELEMYRTIKSNANLSSTTPHVFLSGSLKDAWDGRARRTVVNGWFMLYEEPPNAIHTFSPYNESMISAMISTIKLYLNANLNFIRMNPNDWMFLYERQETAGSEEPRSISAAMLVDLGTVVFRDGIFDSGVLQDRIRALLSLSRMEEITPQSTAIEMRANELEAIRPYLPRLERKVNEWMEGIAEDAEQFAETGREVCDPPPPSFEDSGELQSFSAGHFSSENMWEMVTTTSDKKETTTGS